ncbi:hypothetical protein XAC3218_910165 [Xanthomonas citri pv. citri]|uniref:Uncharacterized protein n=1 Tax=Xanthomonas citri pv. citri TaxID=611301 RepID=A0A0U5FL30_XANCI|nr:hypothetical protein XAC902_1040220 [Xanthomonas citri pv. citri]CEE48554.1 hypothetical protein XAC2911_790217 [Xanthomonas citri pv. citri]CEE56190.1 hypothetical protein XAC3608_1360060 [Xanthomonas citri pv. citri]CEE71579.1 hypothetical protein XAC71A_910220 [Xanthomonas citri pv. citri]CEE89219.1 hypothetical protein XAC3218_910165 [Xanthomonas citri pv. citri]
MLKRLQIGGQSLFGQSRLAQLVTDGHRLAAGMMHRKSSCVVQRQGNAPAALIVVGGTYVAAIRAGHDETPADCRSRLVDRATHARSVDGHAPAFLVARHHMPALRRHAGEMVWDTVGGIDHDGEPAADGVATFAEIVDGKGQMK